MSIKNSTQAFENETRINVRVRGPMSRYLQRQIGPQGIYENQSEYIRDLIRHDMEKEEQYDIKGSLLQGYADLAAGNYRERPMEEIIAEAEQE